MATNTLYATQRSTGETIVVGTLSACALVAQQEADATGKPHYVLGSDKRTVLVKTANG